MESDHYVEVAAMVVVKVVGSESRDQHGLKSLSKPEISIELGMQRDAAHNVTSGRLSEA